MSELNRAYYNETPAKTKYELELHIARTMCCRDECTKAHPLSEVVDGPCSMLRFAFDAGRVLDQINEAGWSVVKDLEVLLNGLDSLQADNARLREALKNLLDRDERNTCQHEETHRSGFLWEICDVCGAKWADDMGGKTEWKDPLEWVAARAALAGEAKP